MSILTLRDPRWLRCGEHRDLRKRVLESFRLKVTIRAIDSECYGSDGEPKDSLDQDTTSLEITDFYCCGPQGYDGRLG